MTKADEVPKETGLIVRPRLLEKLASGPRIRLLLAPAGFGKSELARQFAERAAFDPLLWLELHGAETSVEQLGARVAESLNLHSDSIEAIEDAVKRQQQGLIVLDGYCPSKATDQWLENLFVHCPATLQWLICSRHRPSWKIGKWLLAGDLLLLEGEELAMTASEMELLLRQLAVGRGVSGADLHRQSDGWVAGTRLYLLSLQSSGRRANGQLHRNPLVQEYLDNEVLECLPAEMFSLMPSIAHAPFVDAPLCAFLANDPLALRKLLGQQAFLRRLPGTQDRFSLFTPLKRLLLERYPDQNEPLLAACNWLQLAGLHVEAFRYALAIQDTARALVSVGQISARDLYAGQNLNYLLEGIDQLGSTWIEQHPQALEIVARALLLGGRLEQAECTIRLIDEYERSDLRLALDAELALHQGQAQRARELGFQALDGLAQSGLWAQMILCFSCLTRASLALGDIETAKRLQHQGLELSRRKGEALFECLLMLDQAQIEELAGNLPQALRVLDQLAQLLAQGPGSALLQGGELIRRGWLLILTGQEQQARHTLEEGLLLTQEIRSPVAFYAHALLAQLDANSGDFVSAQQRLTDAQRLMHSWNVAEILYRSVLSVGTARVWLRSQHHGSANQLLSRLREQYEGELALSPPSSFPELHALMGFLQAEALCSRGALGEAGQLLDAVLDWAKGNAFEVIVCQALYALGEVRRLRGDMPQAERFLASAAAMALRQGQHNLLTGLQAEKTELGLQAPQAVNTPPATQVELLSPRELAVLGLIAKGYANSEIATILSLSLHTVKTHAKHINAKLKVSNRTMAVARAKALGLLL